MRISFSLLLVFFGLPLSASAAISISEVAWMGSAASANHEWIELYNDAGPVDATGFVLSDGMNLSIELVGTLPSGYSVLERTSDDSAPSGAWQIYTGAMVNTGATLRLTDAGGALLDQVAGGENWEQIGGDNTTKETAQYTSRGWVTAVATPGSAPPSTIASTPTETEEDDTSGEAVTTRANTTQTKASSATESFSLTLPGITLALAVTGPTIAYVNQPVNFNATPSGVGETIKSSLEYRWNFGDGEVENGKTVAHQFRYPGTYVVTVHGSYKRQEQVAEHEITVLPVVISLTLNRAGDVQINNDSKYTIDLSGYRLRGAGETAFTFAPYTLLRSQQTITIPQARLGNTKERMITLYDQRQVAVATRMPEQLRAATDETVAFSFAAATNVAAAPPPTAASPIRVSPPPPTVASADELSSNDQFGFVKTAAAATGTPFEEVDVQPPALDLARQSAAETEASSSYRYFVVGLILVLLLVYMVPVRNQSA